MSGGGEKKVVCVTGGSGYIASWLVKMLLERGYIVRATIRSLDDPKKTEHLLALDGAKERLHLFEADLTVEGAFDSVVDGCIGVFHTASPVTFIVTDPKAEVLDPAVKGTLNVLKSCAKAQSIKRVVLTSSIATVYLNAELKSGVEIDETWFSDPKLCEELKLWYVLSKTLAEEAASKFAKEKGVDLVILNPSYVIGPLLQPTLNLTCEAILDLINGKWSFYEGHAPYVDVRDVAYAHIQAFEIPSATGRYLLAGTIAYHTEVLNIIHELYPTISLAKNDACIHEHIFPPHKVSTRRAKSLGIGSFISLEVSLKDTIQSLKEKKLYSF